MNILIGILIVLGGIIVLLLLVAGFMTKRYKTHSEIVVNAPLQKAFDHLKHICNQDFYNKWVMMDPDMQKIYKGTDGNVGFIYGWIGNKKAGEGEQEITAIDEGKSVDVEIRFVRPFSGIAHATMAAESLTEKQTKISWSTSSSMKYPLNIMLPTIIKMLEKDMGESLTMLKNILEK